MKEDFFRRITDSEKEDMLAYHELSHYLCSEISRIIEPNFDKPKKIVLSTCKSTPWEKARIVGVCSPKTITKEVLKLYGKESIQVKELEKDFFFGNMMRISHKTLMIASGYLSSSIYVFKDDVEHFINAIHKEHEWVRSADLPQSSPYSRFVICYEYINYFFLHKFFFKGK